ncbi:MAG TPA: AAA family ATPase, partial [Acidimicrobiales bacterium]
NAPRGPFVGRSVEMARVLAVLDRAGDGAPAAVVVAGETGVGKTRFLHECAAAARDRGARTLVGTCVSSEGGGPPYAAVADAVRTFLRTEGPAGPRDDERPVLTELMHAVRGLSDAGDPAGRPSPSRVYDLLVGALTALAANTPVLVAFDDVHWADEATRDAVAVLVANLAADRVATVLAYRSDGVGRDHPLRRFLGEVAARAGIDRLELGRLDRDQLAAVLAASGDGVADHDRFEALWSRSAGNPLFAEELARAEARGEDGVPASLHDLLLTRLCALSPAAQHVVRVAAVGGGKVPHALLAAVAGVDERDVREGLREALAAGALRADAAGDCYEFHHPLLAEVAGAELLPSEDRELHAAYARELTARPALATDPAGPAPELAAHWHAAHELEPALSASVAAGRALEAAHRYDEARRHYERAASLWDEVAGAEEVAGATCAEVLGCAARAADLTGDHEAAIRHALAALDDVDAGADPAAAALLHTRLGGFLSRSGDDAAALVAHDRAVDLAPAGPGVARAYALAGRAAGLLVAGRHADARADAEAALEVARWAGARREEGMALGVLGAALASLGQPDEGLDLVRDAVAVAGECGDPEDVGAAWLHLASVLVDPLDRADEAVAAALEGAGRAEALGLRRCYPVRLRVLAATALFSAGRWDEADALLDRAAAERPSGVAAADLALARASLWTELGRFDDARRAVDSAAVLLRRSDDPGHQAGLSIAGASLAVWQHRIDD